MIITKQMLIDLGACQEGIDTALSVTTFPTTYDTLVKALTDHGDTQDAAWVLLNKSNFIELNGGQKIPVYRIRRPDTETFHEFTSIKDMDDYIVQVGIEMAQLEKNRFTSAQKVTNPDGTFTLIPVNDYQLSADGEYYVYNQFTGENILKKSKAEAEAYIDELKAQFIADIYFIKQQKIECDDGQTTGWVEYK